MVMGRKSLGIGVVWNNERQKKEFHKLITQYIGFSSRQDREN